MQWGFDGEIPELSGLIENSLIPESVVDLVRSRPDFFFFFRAHPIQMQIAGGRRRRTLRRLKYLFRGQANVEFKWASSANLTEILPLVDGHITHHSQTAYECADFGVRTAQVLAPDLARRGEKVLSGLLATDMLSVIQDDVLSLERWAEEVRLETVYPKHEEVATSGDDILNFYERLSRLAKPNG